MGTLMDGKPIAFLSISSQLGGAERSLIDLIEETQATSRFPPLVILPGHGPLEAKLKALNVSYLTIAMPSIYERISRSNPITFFLFFVLGMPMYLIYLYRIYATLEKLNPHSVHSTGIKNHVLCCWLAQLNGFHYYLHLRDYLHPALAQFFKFFSGNKKIHWISASRAITHNLKWHIPILYDGLKSTQFYKNTSPALKQKLGLSEHTKLVGHAAALTPWKGQLAFIEAANEVLKTRSDVHFAIIGSLIYTTAADRDYVQQLKDRVQDLKITDHVHFVPFMEDSRAIYDSLDLFVHSSLTPEPFGRVILEALFCEVPVVAARAGGALEILRLESAKDILHTPGDVSSLVNAIKKGLAFKNSDLMELVQDAKNRFPAEICYKKQVEYLSEAH